MIQISKYNIEGVKTFEYTKIIGLENIKFGKNIIIDDFTLIYASAPMKIGNYVHIASFTSITGGAELVLEDFVAISQGCRILTGTDDFIDGGFGNSTLDEKYRNTKREPVKICKFCIIGANSVILPGVTISEGATVGAGSVVTKDLKPWGVYIGNKQIKERNKDEVLKNYHKFLGESDEGVDKPIYISQPLLPDTNSLQMEIKEIFKSKWITNHGVKHDLFEKKLETILKVNNISLFNNGTIALLTALNAMNLPLGGEVITTPFTFPATPHCISWNGLQPVFCDIDPETMTIDADKIEDLITSDTSAILPVHVYGFPCDVTKINKIAKKHDLKVIYDCAHAFSTEIDGRGIGTFGDISMFSFHATKLFNTVEGGCLAYNNDNLNEKIYYLRNFGIKNEEEVVDIGINGKMNEIQASIGLLNLELFKKEQLKRMEIKKIYINELSKIKNIKLPKMPENTTDSLQYFPILIEEDFPLTRNQIYDEFKKFNIFTRKYFYPICSDYEPYKNLQSSSEDNLPVANNLKNKILCLPFYGNLDKKSVMNICDLFKTYYNSNN